MTKIALITGGSRGLGRSMALQLAAKGWDIILTYRSQNSDAQEVVSGIEKLGQRAVAFQLDVSESAKFDGFVAAIGRHLEERWSASGLDAVVHNAGIGVHAPFVETTEEQFDQLMSIHVKAPFFLGQKLLPLMYDGARIVHISSGLTRFSLPGFAAYSMMKGAVEVLTRYMAKELGARKIRVNTLAPGAIETDFGGGMVRDNKEVNDFVATNTALGRVGQSDDIGNAISILLSEDAGWINAQRIEASGGQFI